MDHPPDNILSYASKPCRWANLRAVSRRIWITLAVFAFLLLVAYSFLRGPTSGQIRLDSGDLRYCWWGVPLEYRQMPEPQRSRLLALAAQAPAIPAKWVTCVTYPLPTSNNTDRMCYRFYYSIAIWADEDPNIARWALDDVVDYIPGMLTRGGPLKSGIILNPIVVDWPTGKVNANWRDQEEVKAYCAEHGYVPPPPPPATGSM